MSAISFNRRRYARFMLPAAYTPVRVHLLNDGRTLEGHAYDVSEGGLQFELDEPVSPGAPVIVELVLPDSVWTERGEQQEPHDIAVKGNVVWTDESEPGPARMAMVLTNFANTADRERFMRQISGEKLSRRAA